MSDHEARTTGGIDLDALRDDALEYAKRSRDSKTETAIAKRLRQIPDSQRLEIILDVIRRSHIIGLSLAKTCLGRRSDFENVLRLGLDTADASQMKLFVLTCYERLGESKVNTILNEYINAGKLDQVEKFEYFSRGYFGHN